MKSGRLTLVALAGFIAGHAVAAAQDSPAARGEYPNIREDQSRPVTPAPVRPEQDLVPEGGVPRGTAGQGRRMPHADEPPGADKQDKAINENAVKAPDDRQE